MYVIGDRAIVNDRMQRSYAYLISEPVGKNFDPGFMPYLSPHEMLQMGVFEGKYCNDCRDEPPSHNERYGDAYVGIVRIYCINGA